MTLRHRWEEGILKVPEAQVPVAPEVGFTPWLLSVCFRGRSEWVGNTSALFLYGLIVFLSLPIKESWRAHCSVQELKHRPWSSPPLYLLIQSKANSLNSDLWWVLNSTHFFPSPQPTGFGGSSSLGPGLPIPISYFSQRDLCSTTLAWLSMAINPLGAFPVLWR